MSIKQLFKTMIITALALSLIACSVYTAQSNLEPERVTQTVGSTTAENAAELTTSTDGLGNASVDTYNHYSDFIAQDRVMTINITLDPDDYAAMLDAPMDETYYPATINIDGVLLENVGFRTKGNSSLMSVANSDSERYSFKIKTDEYEKNQTLLGLDMFVLNNQFNDPSYMREYLSYLAADELGMDTPEMAYVNVYINDRLSGFYLLIEAYDDSFVEKIATGDAILYKAVTENNSLTLNDDGSGFEVKVGDDEQTHIATLISVLNSEDDFKNIEEILDVSSVLKGIALNTVMGNYDSYSGEKAHNYYLLYDEDKFRYIGWDFNMAFGGFPGDNGGSVDVILSSPYSATSAADRPLFSKLLENENYYQEYLGYIQQLSAYFDEFEKMVSGIDALIGDYVKNDPSAFYSYEDYQSNITKQDEDLSAIETAAGHGGMSMPNMGDVKDGDRPTLPTIDDDNQNSAMPTPPRINDEKQRGNRPPHIENKGNGDGMINTKKVSIVDYMLQKLDNIKKQLSN